MARSLPSYGPATPLIDVYERLFAAYGPQHWWPSTSAFETITGAILTQSTAWTNVEQALERLRGEKALTPAAISSLDEAELAELIRPSGYYRGKARKLKAFCTMLEEFGGHLEALLALPQEKLRARLLDTYGIGPETADAIMLYAAGRPSFVIDAYTRRVFLRLELAPEDPSYDAWRSYFMSSLPANAALFNEYHALIVRHAKQSCSKRPSCGACVLRDFCPTGAAACAVAAGQPARQ